MNSVNALLVVSGRYKTRFQKGWGALGLNVISKGVPNNIATWCTHFTASGASMNKCYSSSSTAFIAHGENQPSNAGRIQNFQIEGAQKIMCTYPTK